MNYYSDNSKVESRKILLNIIYVYVYMSIYKMYLVLQNSVC